MLTGISNTLAELGHLVTRVVNIKKNHRPLLLFHEVLVVNKNNQEIFKVNTLLHSAVVIEKPYKNEIDHSNATHIKRMTDHTRKYCSQQPR